MSSALMRRVLLSGALLFAVMASPASAANVTVGCGGLQSALNAASAGEVITLDQLCTTGFPYELPHVPVTLAGSPGAGFQGGSQEQLSGGEASVTIENLIFENATVGGGGNSGALAISAYLEHVSNTTLLHDTFADDVNTEHADNVSGGAFVESEGVVTIEDSTFTDDSALRAGGLSVDAASAHLAGDTFEGDSSESYGGGMYAQLGGGESTLSSSRFSNDTATSSGGGAAISTGATTGIGLALDGDTFSHDSVADPDGTDSGSGYSGGGLEVSASSGGESTLAQSGDTFDSDTVSFKPAAALAMGAGESVSDAALQSVDDRFTNNTLQSPDANKNARMEPVFGWGAGLSVLECGDSFPPAPGAPNVSSSLSDAIIAGNTLTSGPSADGAGIYVGAVLCHSAYTTLDLFDSTVAGNAISGAGGPVAGISGGPHDVLSLANTIVDGDSGGAELGGFGTSFANVSASYSDVCSGSSPFAGTGNICADPQLVGPGPGSADVHETAVSPTLEGGSNALIPSGLTTDGFGNPRISGPIDCTNSPAATVDIGAAEFVYAAPSCPAPVPQVVLMSLLSAPKPLTTVLATSKIGNQLLQLIAPSACTTSSSLLSLEVRSLPIAGAHLTGYKVTHVAFFIDGGLKRTALVGSAHHRHRATVDEPQYQSKKLPSNFLFLPSKVRARPGKNSVLVRVTLVTYTGKGRNRRTLRVIRTLKSTFEVC